MASSSSSFPPCKYDVFLSFRGEDTRDNFTSHLVSALRRKKIETFIDEQVKRGEELSPAILKAIETSKISVIIFSENYASSKWCLDELVKILECHNVNGQIVVPVFYHVDPSHVRKQTTSFGDAFVELEKCFKEMPEKIHKWRAALRETSNLSGWDSMKIRPEAELVERIVKDISKKLKHTSASNDFEGFIGLHSRIERIQTLLSMGLSDFRIVGILGMGGIGKTTIAGAIFNQISNEFEGKSFIANVREESEKSGLVHLRALVLSEILEEELKIETPNLPRYIKERLQRMKVFIVLDDVNKPEQLDYVVGRLDQFGPGSRILVTTRDKQVLDKCRVDYIYEVERLNYHEANELFCNYAFRQDHQAQDLQMLSESLRYYAGGNPLALKVLGSSFHQKTKEEWEIVLHELKWIFDPGIYNVLKISYDELTWEEQNIFLDIACFFKGEDKNQVTTILANRYSVHYGLKVLVDKSLITIFNNKLQMHDLLQEMGREIVDQECKKDPGKRTRLWYHGDICRVLKKNKGSDSIEAIFLDLSKIRDINLSSRAFANMSNLRLLKLYMPKCFHSDISSKVHLPQGLEYLSDELTYLHWYGFPLRELPMNFSPENLIQLSLPYSKVQQLWEGKKEAFNLKSINLCHSQYITRIPDPSEIPNVERINLLNCISLSGVPANIQNFNNLGVLCLKGCKSLRYFPHNIHFRSSITIDFSFCVNLIEFPLISGNIIELDLRETAVEEVPSSVENLTSLTKLNMSHCTRLKSISTSFCKLKSLHQLCLDYCSNLDKFPKILKPIEGLKHTSSFEHLEGLTELWLSDSSELGRSPEFSFPECKGLVWSPLSSLSNLTELYLSYCGTTKIPQDIGLLSSLRRLNLRGNDFENLPPSIKQLSQLRFLYLSDCSMLQSLPELPLRLDFLEAHNCKLLQSLPKLPESVELNASVLENLSLRSYTFSWTTIEFIFANCTKLNEKGNNILADSQLRIQHMAITSLRRFYAKEFNAPCGINICLPGSRIPKWFSNRSFGSSVTVQLPQYCCNSNFIGFALCAVIGKEEDSNACGGFFQVICSYSVKTEKEHFDNTCSLSNGVFIESDDHVVLGFHPFWDVSLPDDDHHTTISFEFYHQLPSCYGIGFKVKCCGVCPLYAHLKETKHNTFTVNMMPPSEEERNQIMKLHDKFHNKTGTSGITGSICKSKEEKLETSTNGICKGIFKPLILWNPKM